MSVTSQYRQIFKATSLFGGVQVFTILITIVRSKFIAVLLGPTGMGVNAILMSTQALIASFTSLGLPISAVKNIAAANTDGDPRKLKIVVNVFWRWLVISGLLGFLIAVSLSAIWSKLGFGDYGYTRSFALISITVFVTQLFNGLNTILQGTRKLKDLAIAGLLSNAVALLFTIPLYYFLGVKGIVPAIISTALITLGITALFYRKHHPGFMSVERATWVNGGKEMLKLGFVLNLSALLTMIVSYATRAYVANVGSLGDVGLYNAGFAIVSSYVGLIFTAMSTDYFPRLSAVAEETERANEEINRQAEMALLILTPILTVFLLGIDVMIKLLYSAEFLSITKLVHWSALAMIFKSTSWSIAMIFIARGDSKFFFWNEVLANFYFLILNILGYYFWGLDGLGYAFCASFILYTLQVIWIVKRKYGIFLHKQYWRMMLFQGSLCLLSIGVYNIARLPNQLLFGTVLVIGSSFYSFSALDQRMQLRSLIKSRFNK